MRPPNQIARDRLLAVLARHPRVAASVLAEALGVSLATMHRLLEEQSGHVVAAGRARRARYALRRSLRGSLAPLPVFEVDADGRARQVAELALLHPEGSWLSLEGSHWPVPDDEARDGWWPGLPYPLADMRPQGYLGRQFALAQSTRLGVAPNPEAWGDDDIAWVLSQAGADCSGSLIVGQPAFELWQQQRLQATPALAGEDLEAWGAHCAALAEQAVAQGVPGSSAAGEFPKFPARRALRGALTPQVLVKFSGADRSATVQRWADLLVCEHLALEAARVLPAATVAASRIVRHAGRTFLEVERFDRHGDFGRSPLVSLGTVDAALLGSGTADWRALTDRLWAQGWTTAEDRLATHHLWWYGRLIANTDMHAANLSFRPVAGREKTERGSLALAPVYDMLPMLFAPLAGGELPRRTFEPALPLPSEAEVWACAAAAALGFWQRAADDRRISGGFRATCADAARRLEDLGARPSSSPCLVQAIGNRSPSMG